MVESDTQPPAHNEIHAIPPEDAADKERPGSPPNTPLVSEVPPTQPHDRERCHCRPDQTPLWKQTLEYVAAVCGIALVVITLYYTRAAYRQAAASEVAANAAESAADTATKTLGLDTAIIQGSEAAYVPAARLAMEKDQAVIIFFNSGKVAAKNLVADVEISKQTLPDYRLIGQPQKYTLRVPLVPPSSFEIKSKLLFKGYHKSDADRVALGTEAITISASYQYDNGFGSIVHGKFCNSLVTLVYANGSTTGGGWNDCADVPMSEEMTVPLEKRKPW